MVDTWTRVPVRPMTVSAPLMVDRWPGWRSVTATTSNGRSRPREVRSSPGSGRKPRRYIAKKVLIRLAQLIEAHAEELALLETLDMGKPISDSLNVDVAATVRCFSWNGEVIDKWYAEIAPTGPDELGLVTREPLGVVAAIVPWKKK